MGPDLASNCGLPKYGTTCILVDSRCLFDASFAACRRFGSGCLAHPLLCWPSMAEHDTSFLEELRQRQLKDASELLLQERGNHAKAQQEHVANLQEIHQKIEEQKAQSEKARKDIQDALSQHLESITKVELCHATPYQWAVSMAIPLVFVVVMMVALLSYLQPVPDLLVGLVFGAFLCAVAFICAFAFLYCWESGRKTKTGQELVADAMQKCTPLFEMLWQEPACLQQVKREVDHLSQTIPRAHLLEQEALKKTSYPDLLIRAVSAESMADVESRRNRELQCKLDALQSGLGALRSEQEKTTNVLQQVADRPAVVNHTYNDSRSYSSHTNHTSISFEYSDQSSWTDIRQMNVLAAPLLTDSDRVRQLLAIC